MQTCTSITDSDMFGHSGCRKVGFFTRLYRSAKYHRRANYCQGLQFSIQDISPLLHYYNTGSVYFLCIGKQFGREAGSLGNLCVRISDYCKRSDYNKGIEIEFERERAIHLEKYDVGCIPWFFC